MNRTFRPVCIVVLQIFTLCGNAEFLNADPLPNSAVYRVVSMEGLQHTEWTNQLLQNEESYNSTFEERGTAGAIHILARPFKLSFRKNPVTRRLEARAPSIEFKVELQEVNTPTFNCIGECGDPPDLSDRTSDCGDSTDASFFTIRYLLGHMFILPRAYGDFVLPEEFINAFTTVLPPIFIPPGTNIPVGTILSLCGPHFVNTSVNGGVAYDDFRYPFAPDVFGSLVNGFNSAGADRRVLNPRRTTLRLQFSSSVPFQFNDVVNGNGNNIDGSTLMDWTMVLKRRR